VWLKSSRLAALLVSCVIVALSSAINTPKERSTAPPPQNNTAKDGSAPGDAKSAQAVKMNSSE